MAQDGLSHPACKRAPRLSYRLRFDFWDSPTIWVRTFLWGAAASTCAYACKACVLCVNAGPLAATPVDSAELLARFIFTKRYLRNEGGTLTARAEAFAPYKHVTMSTTRHRGLSEEEIWLSGAEVARRRGHLEGRSFQLIGRADFLALHSRQQNLDVIPEDPPPNHADVIGWPLEKPAQMVCALEIAINSSYLANTAQDVG